MTQEEKLLLVKDLSARVLYGPKVKVLHVWNEEKEIEEDIVDTVYCVLPDGYINTETIDSDIPLNDNIILYLRPMSSMTAKEWDEFGDLYDPFREEQKFYEIIDWFNEKHFDHRGLIEKGLALEAPEGMYKTE